jgi:hypothetical protein
MGSLYKSDVPNCSSQHLAFLYGRFWEVVQIDLARAADLV